MGMFQSKKSYQVEKEEKKKGVVEQRKRTSNRPDVARNTIQMREEAKQNIIEAERRTTLRFADDIEKVQNEIKTTNVEDNKVLQTENVETIESEEKNTNKPEKDDVTPTTVVKNTEEEKLNNTENLQSETEPKDLENIDKTEKENLISTRTVQFNDTQIIENHENTNENVIKNEVIEQSLEQVAPQQTSDSLSNVKPINSEIEQETVNVIDKQISSKSEEISQENEDSNKEETKTVEVYTLKEKEETAPERSPEEHALPKESLEKTEFESEVKQDESISDSNEDIKLENEIIESNKTITVIDVHSPVEPKETIKDENKESEIKIETYKVETKNEQSNLQNTLDLNKIEVYKSDETLVKAIKLHEDIHEREIKESNNDNIKFDVEIYTYKEDNQEKIMEVEETEVRVTNINVESEQANTEDKSLKRSIEATVNVTDLNKDNNDLEGSCTISGTTKSTEIPKELPSNHVEIKTKVSEEKIDPFLKIREIEEEAKILKDQVILFSGTTKDKDYITLKEMLIRCMIKLDDIAVADNDEVRNERRKIIKFVQDALDTLQRNVVQADGSSGEDSDTEKI